MPHCKQDGSDVPLILLFSAISLGALSSGIPCGLFIHKWYTCIKDFDSKKSRLIQLTGLVLWTLPFERCLRLVEISFRFFIKDRFWANLCYYFNNLISIACICIASFLLQTARLKLTFKGSSYKVNRQELRAFYALIALLTSMMYLTSVCLGIKVIPRYISVTMGFLSGGLAIMIVLKLEVAFATRLRGLVAKQTAHSIHTGIASPTVKAHVQHSPHWSINNPNHSMSDFSVPITPRTPTKGTVSSLNVTPTGASNAAGAFQTNSKRDTLSIGTAISPHTLTPGDVTPTDSCGDDDYGGESSEQTKQQQQTANDTTHHHTSSGGGDSGEIMMVEEQVPRIKPPKLTMILDVSPTDMDSENNMNDDNDNENDDKIDGENENENESGGGINHRSTNTGNSDYGSGGGTPTVTVVSMDDPAFAEFDIFKVRPTLRIIHESSISHFDDPHRDFLRAATKSTLMTLWMTVAIIFFTGGIMFMGIGQCDEAENIAGHILYGIGDLILSMCFYLSLSQCYREYNYCCSWVNRWISKVVAYQTGRQVRELTSQQMTQNEVIEE